jgi:hypothetical protein
MIKDTVGLQEDSKNRKNNEISVKLPCCDGGELLIKHTTPDIQLASDVLEKLFLHIGVKLEMTAVRKGGGGT